MASEVTYENKEEPRHPFGLPAGSVRAVLSLGIVSLFWTIALLPESKNIPIPLFLYFMLALIGMFFMAHGRSIGTQGRHAWGLPRFTFRILIILVSAGAIGLHYYLYDHGPWNRFIPHPNDPTDWPKLFIAVIAGLLLGRLIGHGPWRQSAAFQDIQAWISLLGMLGLGVETILHVMVNPQLGDDLKIPLINLEAVLTGIVAWYFAARS
jgi:hypothetical protein